MKKQYFPKLNTRSRSGNRFSSIVWIFGGVFVLALLITFFQLFLPGVLMVVAEPFWKGGTALETGVGNTFVGIGNSVKLAQENTVLTAEVSTLENENAVLTARSQDLTKLLGGQSGSEANILAGVLARPPQSPYDTVIVAAGAKDGIVANAVAFATGGIPIGTITGVTAHTATIQLFSTPGRIVNGWVGENRVPLTISGIGGGAFTATLPKAAPIAVGDSVYLPGPGAVPIGTISRIDSDPSAPTVVLHIQPMVNIFSITWIEVSRMAQTAF